MDAVRLREDTLNYRHAFHAGNFADVVKHVGLSLALERLNAKPGSWRYIDSHAGAGLYDLDGDEARRNPEWRDGVGRIWASLHTAPPQVVAALDPFVKALRAVNADAPRFYPGSPVIAQAMARPGDAIRLCELHAPSAESLKAAMGRDERVKIEARDGYEALPAYLPPPERRGLVLIDPPFEEGTADRRLDFERMQAALLRALRRWPAGSYFLWRPLKDVRQAAAFDAALASSLAEAAKITPDKLLVADLWTRDLTSEGGLAGAGLVMVNPPYQVREKLAVLMPWLARLMAQGEGAGWRLESPTRG